MNRIEELEWTISYLGNKIDAMQMELNTLLRIHTELSEILGEIEDNEAN